MFWKGKKLLTVGDVVHAFESCETEFEARDFYARYEHEKGEQIAAIDLGYITGYMSPAARDRLFEWLPDLEHPMLGRRTDFTPEELVEVGRRWALGEFPHQQKEKE
jgi:hypothetical protein